MFNRLVFLNAGYDISSVWQTIPQMIVMLLWFALFIVGTCGVFIQSSNVMKLSHSLSTEISGNGVKV